MHKLWELIFQLELQAWKQLSRRKTKNSNGSNLTSLLGLFSCAEQTFQVGRINPFDGIEKGLYLHMV
ncbi:hypothetical protein P8452_61465 [Trifolium repens]|nr:hypothetical protein P8452_61465 [Trifolium repens]